MIHNERRVFLREFPSRASEFKEHRNVHSRMSYLTVNAHYVCVEFDHERELRDNRLDLFKILALHIFSNI